MNASEIRDMAWEDMRDRLGGAREAVWLWLRVHGPSTTREIAEGTGLDLLTARPRTSELCAWGFAECVGRRKGEGVYKALPMFRVRARWEAAGREGEGQMEFEM